MNLQPAAPDIRVFPDGRLDSENAAAYLGVTQKSLAIWRCQGTGPEYIKLGKRCFYHRDTLDTWIQTRRATSTAEFRAKRKSA